MSYQIETHVAKRLQDFFAQFDFIDKVEVFGSRARHDASPKSDIDLCIYSLEMSDKEFTKLKIALDELPILYKVDIVHFESSNDALKKNILRDGKLFFVRIVKLTSICEPKQHKTISKNNLISDGQYAVYGANGIIGKYNSYTHIEKTLLITCRGATCGTLNICEPMSYVNGNAMALNNLSKNVDLNYLYYSLNERKFNDVITGTAQPQITKENLEKVKIYLPSLTKQKQIAKTLDKAQELIELRKESIDKLDALAKSIFINMFGDPVSNPKKWKIEILKNITSKIGSGSTPRGGKDSYKDEGISLIRSLNIHDNKFKYKDLAFIDDNQADKLSNVIVQKDDVLLNITGASVCRSSIVPNDVLPARVNQHVAIIRAKENLNPKFLLHLFISVYKKELMQIASTGGATREALTKDDIEQLKIPLPDITLQNKFANTIQKVEQQKSLYQEELTKLQENFDALLAESFKG